MEHSEKVFTELISSMDKRRVKITDTIRAQEKSEVSRVEELILTLEQEISDLRKKHAELGQLSLIDDDIYVIQVTELFDYLQQRKFFLFFFQGCFHSWFDCMVRNQI